MNTRQTVTVGKTAGKYTLGNHIFSIITTFFQFLSHFSRILGYIRAPLAYTPVKYTTKVNGREYCSTGEFSMKNEKIDQKWTKSTESPTRSQITNLPALTPLRPPPTY
jgi:hypothetical protein